MAGQRSSLQWLCSLLVLVGVANALKFDLLAHGGSENARKERCIRNFVGQETLVVVTAKVGGSKGDGMVVNMHVSCTVVRCPLGLLVARRGTGGVGGCGC
jgi:hypothetical protein